LQDIVVNADLMKDAVMHDKLPEQQAGDSLLPVEV
jgi:hypothetical protein